MDSEIKLREYEMRVRAMEREMQEKRLRAICNSGTSQTRANLEDVERARQEEDELRRLRQQMQDDELRREAELEQFQAEQYQADLDYAEQQSAYDYAAELTRQQQDLDAKRMEMLQEQILQQDMENRRLREQMQSPQYSPAPYAMGYMRYQMPTEQMSIFDDPQREREVAGPVPVVSQPQAEAQPVSQPQPQQSTPQITITQNVTGGPYGYYPPQSGDYERRRRPAREDYDDEYDDYAYGDRREVSPRTAPSAPRDDRREASRVAEASPRSNPSGSDRKDSMGRLTPIEVPEKKKEPDVRNAPSGSGPSGVVYNERLTFEEAYLLLDSEQKAFCDGLRRHAVERSGRKEKLSRYHLSVGSGRGVIMRLAIKNGMVVAYFRIENEQLRELRLESESRAAIKVKETQVTILNQSAFDTAKDMIDLRLSQLN